MPQPAEQQIRNVVSGAGVKDSLSSRLRLFLSERCAGLQASWIHTSVGELSLNLYPLERLRILSCCLSVSRAEPSEPTTGAGGRERERPGEQVKKEEWEIESRRMRTIKKRERRNTVAAEAQSLAFLQHTVCKSIKEEREGVKEETGHRFLSNRIGYRQYSDMCNEKIQLESQLDLLLFLLWSLLSLSSPSFSLVSLVPLCSVCV